MYPRSLLCEEAKKQYGNPDSLPYFLRTLQELKEGIFVIFLIKSIITKMRILDEEREVGALAFSSCTEKSCSCKIPKFIPKLRIWKKFVTNITDLLV